MTYSGHVLPWVLLFGGWLAAAGLLAAAWTWYRRRGNVGVVDVAWTMATVVVTVWYAAAGPGDARRRWLMAGMVTVWGVRLAAYLVRDRIAGRAEDPRYATLRARRSIAAAGDFFVFFQAQAVAAVILSAPMLIAAIDPNPQIGPLEIAAVLLWGAALAGEAAADRQLERFKADAGNRGRTCRTGLWRYSRHPNYFFEWLIWLAYALYALSSPAGPLALTAPAIMLFLLFRVTGIPATEAQALASKGQDYRDYQATTSVFVPWPPRRSA